MARLRTMRGVQRVSLSSSEKAEGQGGGGGGNSGDCRGGNSKFPMFQLVIFFDAPKSASAPPADGAAPAQGATPTQGAATTTGAPPATQPTSTGTGQ
jgi:hypothetical protein